MSFNKACHSTKREKTYTNADLPWIPAGCKLIELGSEERLFSPSGIWIASITRYKGIFYNDAVRENSLLFDRVTRIFADKKQYEHEKFMKSKEAEERRIREQTHRERDILLKELL